MLDVELLLYWLIIVVLLWYSWKITTVVLFITSSKFSSMSSFMSSFERSTLTSVSVPEQPANGTRIRIMDMANALAFIDFRIWGGDIKPLPYSSVMMGPLCMRAYTSVLYDSNSVLRYGLLL